MRRCIAGWGCEPVLRPDRDLTVIELMQAVAHGGERSPGSYTLWADGLSAMPPRHQQGLNVAAVIEALRTETARRGLARSPE